MEANDLRIGNYVDYANVICEVTSYSKSGFLETNGVTAPISAYQPILITDKWLTNLGFSFPESEFEAEVIVKRESRFSAIRGKGFYSVGISGPFGLYLVKVKYVHHLQNLYHSLFGENLTIKY